MKIFRYTTKLAKLLGTKTKPEPWLHIAILDERDKTVGYTGGITGYDNGRLPTTRQEYGKLYYVIYVWDTRHTVEAGTSSYTGKLTGSIAKDNRKPLIGNSNAGALVMNFNHKYFNK